MSDIDILGIDLGTTKSVMAIWELQTGETRVLPNCERELITPSVVTFDAATGRPIVGGRAVERLLHDPDNVAYSVKRFIGRPPEDRWVRYDRELVTYDVEEDAKHRVVVEISGRHLTPPEISAEVLRKLKDDAAMELGGCAVTQAVISHPAYFNEAQRRATQQAGELAGLSVLRIIPEPTAAALAFGLGQEPETVAVYDLGGGTFDISVLRIEHGLFRVKAIGGDTHLGGDDLDQTIVTWLQEQWAEQHPGIALPLDRNDALKARLREAARRAKTALTDAASSCISLPDLLTVDGHPRDLQTTLTRTTFETLIRPFVNQTLQLVDATLQKAGVKGGDLSQILLVGGQTRTPSIQAAIRERYGRPLNTGVKPEEAVARGAAILGARLCGYLKEQVALWDVIPLSLGVELADGSMDVIIAANEPIPVEKWRRGAQAFTTQRDGQKSIQFNIYQGERPMAADNTRIGEAILLLATPRRAGEHRVNCLFKVNANGILTVRAESDDEGKPVEVRFDQGSLSPSEVQAKLREAEAHRADDALTRRLLQLVAEAGEVRAACGACSADDPIVEQLAEADAAIRARDADRAAHLLNGIRRML